MQWQYFEHPEIFSAEIPASYSCNNSNSSFLKSENDTIQDGRSPRILFHRSLWNGNMKYTIFKEFHDKRGMTTRNAKLAELSLGAIVSK
jgi:hypothetical protein